MGRVEGKVALVTGCARGQGRAHAITLAREGANIIGFDALADDPNAPYAMSTQADLDETVRLVESVGGKIVTGRADVRDLDAVQAMVTAGVEQFGRLDIVAASAGISPRGAATWDITDEGWRSTLDVNLTGVRNTIAAAVPAVIAAGNGGSIVCTSSAAGLKFVPGLADYNAAKAGVVALAKTLANELAPLQIRVNALAPGTVNTPMVSENAGTFALFRPDLEAPTLEDCLSIFASMMPMGHPWIEVEDVANALLFLASDEARYITGQVIAVDQGVSNKAV